MREIRGTKINPKSSFKNQGAQNTRGRKLREQIRYLKSVTAWASVFSKKYVVAAEKMERNTKKEFNKAKMHKIFIKETFIRKWHHAEERRSGNEMDATNYWLYKLNKEIRKTVQLYAVFPASFSKGILSKLLWWWCSIQRQNNYCLCWHSVKSETSTPHKPTVSFCV